MLRRGALASPFPVESYPYLTPRDGRGSAYCGQSNHRRVRVTLKARRLVLTGSQAACLVALRHRKESLSEIAIAAKLDLRKTALALRALERFGCAEQGDANSWHATVPGK